MAVVLRYFMIVLACAALLAGIQLPNLVDQYAKRVDAHWREVTVNFQPYQEIANANMQGSVDLLIQFHRKNAERVFQAEANAIERMYQRKLRYEKENAAMQRNLALRIGHIFFLADRETLNETLDQYSANVPLNQGALITGAVVALVILLVFELLLALVLRISTLIRRWLNHRWHGAD
jgi:hypothetical protein